jgi:hypothetical protein
MKTLYWWLGACSTFLMFLALFNTLWLQDSRHEIEVQSLHEAYADKAVAESRVEKEFLKIDLFVPGGPISCMSSVHTFSECDQKPNERSYRQVGRYCIIDGFIEVPHENSDNELKKIHPIRSLPENICPNGSRLPSICEVVDADLATELALRRADWGAHGYMQNGNVIGKGLDSLVIARDNKGGKNLFGLYISRGNKAKIISLDNIERASAVCFKK